LFARDAARNDENWTFVAADAAPQPLWFARFQKPKRPRAMTKPASHDVPDDFVDQPELLQLMWTEHLDAARIARYALYEHDTFYERPFPLFFRADGSGWCREAWNRDDLPFQHRVSAHEWMEAPASFLARYGPQIYDDHLNSQLEDLYFDVPAPDLSWLCGSPEELAQLTKWICALETHLWQNAHSSEIDVYYQAESEFFRAGVQAIHGERYFSNSFHFNELTGERQISYHGNADLRVTRRFLTLTDLAVDYNTPTGFYWEYHDQA
jgi:hypothetical protein